MPLGCNHTLMTSDALSFFACLGINHRTASVGLREKFAVPQRKLAETTHELQRACGMAELVLLSTCNRTELYFVSADVGSTQRAVIAHFLGADSTVATSAFYLHRDAAALRHLAMVAAGLDSMVIGETEIFGQLKDAYRTACCASTAGRTLHRIFQSIFSIGKKVRSSTLITVGPTSVGAAAVALAREILGDLEGANVLVVGAGDVARSTAQSLRSRGAQSIFVANRSYERAQALAQDVDGRVIRFSQWMSFLEQIDIVIVSTAAPVYVVTQKVVEQVCAARSGRPLFIIDLSVPRNADPACAAVKGVTLYDMDALQARTRETMQQRHLQVQQGAQLIEQWLTDAGLQLLPQPVYTLASPGVASIPVALVPAKKTDFF